MIWRPDELQPCLHCQTHVAMGGKPAGNAESRIMTAFVKSVSEAEKAMRALFPETPLQLNDYLSRKYGAEIWLKREDLTPVRSYKIRGAFNFISKAVETTDKNAVFVCASAGNHARVLHSSAAILAARVSFSCRLRRRSRKSTRPALLAANSLKSSWWAIFSTFAMPRRRSLPQARRA